VKDFVQAVHVNIQQESMQGKGVIYLLYRGFGEIVEDIVSQVLAIYLR